MIVWSVIRPSEHFTELARLFAVLVLGVAIAPFPPSKDFTETAALAVDQLHEMHRSNGVLIENLSAAIPMVPEVQHVLGRASDELDRQRYQFITQTSYWAKVSPGTADEVVKTRGIGKTTLMKLERDL